MERALGLVCVGQDQMDGGSEKDEDKMVGDVSAGTDDAGSCSAVVPNVGYTPHGGGQFDF